MERTDRRKRVEAFKNTRKNDFSASANDIVPDSYVRCG